MDQKFYNLAIKFLDRVYGDTGPSDIDSYIIYQRYNQYHEYDETFFEYDYTDGRLFIDISVIKLMKSLLSIPPNESRILVCHWFSERNNVEIASTDTPGGYDRIEF